VSVFGCFSASLLVVGGCFFLLCGYLAVFVGESLLSEVSSLEKQTLFGILLNTIIRKNDPDFDSLLHVI
jgi:hypothetical protein